ncbi:MAG: ABC transporter permease [Anaerolineae bacterium]|nr:ABC transporter permease [Anaerolineae bacterium]
MTHYILRRLLLSVVVLFGVTIFVAGMLHISGDPVAVILESGIAGNEEREELRRELGLDRPFLVQYLDFVTRAVQGDLGRSLRFRQPALTLVMERLSATVQLAVAAMLFSVAVAVPIGISSAVKPNSVIDNAGRLLTLAGQSIPLFWLGIMLVLVFAVKLRWLPVAGRLEPTSIILPALTLGLYPMARIARVLRANMLEVLSKEYCRTARAKGLTEHKVVVGHALQNAALPVITVMGLQFGYLLGGAVVTETIFAWPGLGWLSVQAVSARDFPLVQAIVAVVALMFIFINLLTDVLYAYLNPQIRYN